MSASGHPASGLSGVRRRIPRYPVAIPVDITVLRAGAPASIPGRSLDIGEGGVAAVLAAELQPGEWVAVELQLPNARHALQTKAVVRHHNQLRCGFEFLGTVGRPKLMIRSGRAWPNLCPRPENPRTPASASPSTRMTAPNSTPAPGVQARRPPSPLRRVIWRWNACCVRPWRCCWGVGLWRHGNGIAAGSSWNRAWRERSARATALGKVPAEVMERLLVRRVDRCIRKPLGGQISRAWSCSTRSLRPMAPWSIFVRSAAPTRWFPRPWTQLRWWRFRPYPYQGEPAPVEDHARHRVPPLVGEAHEP